MSRSRKKTPVHGWTTAKSEKDDKRICNRRLRRKATADPETTATKHTIMDVWSMGKDGKHYWKKPEHDDSSRFDPLEKRLERWKKMLRK